MISLNNEPSAELEQVPQSRPEVKKHSVSFTLNDHIVDGIGRGSAKDLMFRPNASFHPIRDVKQDGRVCQLSFDRPLMEVNRSLSEREVLNLLRSLRLGVRECALGQQLYLYPGLESFGLSLSGDLKIAFVNVRPKNRFIDHNTQHMSVLAFFELLKAYCPRAWQRIEAQSSQIVTLASLEAHLIGPSLSSRVRALARAIFILAFITFVSSIPIALYGPPSMRDPLREVLHPIFNVLSQHLSPEPSPHSEQPHPSGVDVGAQPNVQAPPSATSKSVSGAGSPAANAPGASSVTPPSTQSSPKLPSPLEPPPHSQ